MKTEAIPRVGVIDALSTGLVEAARRPWLLIIPLITELFVWLAPPVSVAGLLQRLARLWEGLLLASQVSGESLTSMADTAAWLREMAAELGEVINLAENIAGGWFGAPGVISTVQASRMTFISDLVLAPAGFQLHLGRLAPAPWQGSPLEVPNLWLMPLVLAGFWVIGQVVSTAYLRWAAWSLRPREQHAGLGGLLKLTVRLAVFNLLLGIVTLVLSLPLAFAVTLLRLSSSSALAMVMLLLSGVALWLTLWFLTSMFFVGEAVVLDRQSVARGIARSITLVHQHFWQTLGLALLINLLVYGFRVVWELVGQSPLGTGVAMVGNAYLVTGMLLGIFVFYDNLAQRPLARRVVSS